MSVPPGAAVADLYRARWGEPSRRAHLEVAEFSIEVLKWLPEASGEGSAIYATVGASSFAVPDAAIGHRVEFFVGLRPGEDAIASPRAALGLYAQREWTALDHGHTVPSDGALWRGTGMSAFLVLRPRTEFLPALDLSEGLHVEFLQAVPIYDAERDFKARHGSGALLAYWSQRRIPFWDPGRPEAVPD